MAEIHALTARLGVTQRAALEDGDNADVKALSVRSAEPVKAYKKALVKAKEKTLPDLFKKIEASNKMMATWMKVKIMPLEAEAEALNGTVGLVRDRIFSVELYAGLVEEAKQVKDGAPTPNDTQVHLMQRRAYMDEECLVGYEHGGMDYKNIDDFEKWLCKPANFNRLFPYPRTLLAFRVRRNDKEREVNMRTFIQVMNEKDWDKTTFLYVRNGEQLHRIETKIEFEEQLFPDTNHKIFTNRKLWAKKHFLRNIDDVISDEEHQGKIEEEKTHAEKLKEIPEKDHWRHRLHFDTSDQYHEVTPENVYYDDVMKVLDKEKKKHNRLVLVMQGILDRSPMLHPHPPWQLWTPAGFAAAFKLIYDGSRALSAGDKPDFEAYRAECNRYLCSGSVTIGQEVAWEVREADRENRRRQESHSYHYSDHEYTRYRPPGDPGPGKLAVVARYSEKNHSVSYKWMRENKRGPNETSAALTTGQENVLNVDAYKPGDFHLFFDDPRTRQEYLHWAPMLLEAEECHAGNRDLKPNKFLPAVPKEPFVVPGEERPADLNFSEKPKTQPIAEKYVGQIATMNYDMSTKGGTKFKKGERVEITYYSRRKVSLSTLDDFNRHIINVEINHVTLTGERK
jgi:hypothetical protein